MNRAPFAFALLLAISCDPVVVGKPPSPAPSPEPTAVAPPPATPEAADHDRPDFQESPQNRDPFRRDLTARGPTGPSCNGAAPIMTETDVTAMQLVGVIEGHERATALVLDRAGEGHLVHRGSWVGSHERHRLDDDLAVDVCWRVARIRRGEVVLEQHDPRTPDRPGRTHVLALPTRS